MTAVSWLVITLIASGVDLNLPSFNQQFCRASNGDDPHVEVWQLYHLPGGEVKWGERG